MPEGNEVWAWAALAAAAALAVGIAALAAGRARAARHLAAVEDARGRAERGLREELARQRLDQASTARALREEVGGAVRTLGETLDRRLAHLHAENERRLEAMRAVVDEKLEGTLGRRIGESFRQVSERLEAVHQGLGEMQGLAAGVGDLKRVLSNVKARGTFGEIQLGALLEQVLAPAQYAANVATVPGSGERVEYAIRLPGAEGAEGPPVWLPVDAKFPQEDAERLAAAQERGDAAAAEQAGRALEGRLREEARRIRRKYVRPPATTDFALLFLPTEGLYAEALRRPGLVERLQREDRVVLAGPTTLAALLNSLQMGFRTLAIQERSGEVWRLLGVVKGQLAPLGEILARVEKRLEEAQTGLGAAARKTRHLERRLGRIESVGAPHEPESAEEAADADAPETDAATTTSDDGVAAREDAPAADAAHRGP